MINYIKSERNFFKIKQTVGKYMSLSVSLMLEKGISHLIQEVWIEYPYIDKDFRDTYYNDFSKRFADISRDSVRIHFFFARNKIESGNYAGFITLRDTAEFTIGRSYLSPKALSNLQSGYCCLARYIVQFKGLDLNVMAFPWMQQDGNISRCAHIAAWSVIRYFSQKYTYYPEKTLHEITTHDSNTRRIPSKGATVDQIAQILRKNRFETEIYVRELLHEKPIEAERLFGLLMYSIIESGIPFVAGLRKKHHAVAVIGHGSLASANATFGQDDGIVDCSDLIESIILSDDNDLPYKNAYNYEKEDEILVPDIDVIIVPFYQKMYLDVQVLYETILPKLESSFQLTTSKTLIRRVFMTSSRSFKRKCCLSSKDDTYREVHLLLQMPKFIWIVEYATISEYDRGRVRARILFDATMLKFTDGNFISFKNENQLCVYSQNTQKPSFIRLVRKTEPRYENNLRSQ